MESISSVTMPALWRKCNMQKYTTTYLKYICILIHNVIIKEAGNLLVWKGQA
ncbi:hypothetical protein Hanom_Chr15g01402261 [Helianthus anomalus]